MIQYRGWIDGGSHYSAGRAPGQGRSFIGRCLRRERDPDELLALDQLAQPENDAGMRPVEQFAANIRARRYAAELSQEQLARLADIHPTEISRLERAVRDPRLSTILRIAGALEVTPSELLAGVR